VSHELVISIHIPKTGGTSLVETASQVYKRNCLRLSYTPTLEEAYHELCKKGIYNTRFIHGHIPYGLHEFLPPDVEYKYIIFLRNPYDRLLSLYNFSFYTRSNPPVFDLSFTKWFKREKTATIRNDMTRIIANTPKNFLGIVTIKDKITYKDYLKAVENLKNFYFIGLTETYTKSLNALANCLGWNFIPYQEKIYSYPDRIKIEDLSDEEVLMISKTQKYDILLYDKAKEIAEQYDYSNIRKLKIKDLRIKKKFLYFYPVLRNLNTKIYRFE